MTVRIQVDEQRPLTACVLSCKRGVSMPISPIWVRCMSSEFARLRHWLATQSIYA